MVKKRNHFESDEDLILAVRSSILHSMIHIYKSRKLSLLFLGIVLSTLVTYLWFFAYLRVPSLDVFYSDRKPSKHDGMDSFFSNLTLEGNFSAQDFTQTYMDYRGIADLRKVKAHSRVYDRMFENHDMNSILGNLNFNQRCELYFTTLSTIDENWWVDPNKDLPVRDYQNFQFDDWRSKHLNRLKKEFATKEIENEAEREQKLEDYIKQQYAEFWKETMETEQTIMDYLSHGRIFDRCFISNNEADKYESHNKFTQNQHKFMQRLLTTGDNNEGVPPFEPTEHEKDVDTSSSFATSVESKLYPWLTFQLPKYVRWSGEKYDEIPIMADFGLPIPSPSKKKVDIIASNSTGFLNKFKHAVNGQGIVLTIGNHHVGNTLHLIRLLRVHRNQYPIQFVFYDGLSDNSKARIVEAARRPMAIPESFQNVSQYFPEDYVQTLNNSLPAQEVWFVDVKESIKGEYRGRFNRFNNKFLATMFNSFEEFLLIDSDTVMMQPPSYFFNLSGFRETGAFFYRDRTLNTRPKDDGIFFTKISPSYIDSVMFDIPTISEKTLKIPFLHGLRHYMESGVVVLSRTRHFGSMLTMIQMNFMGAVRDRVYGDKEIFWLAFAANGDEDYAFNKFPAASIGTMSKPGDHVTSHGVPKKAREICSGHPAHIDGYDGKSLVWFNSGFHFCVNKDRLNYDSEFEKNKKFPFLQTPDEMREFYNNPIVITQAIIPPFETVEQLHCENIDEEPNVGWTEPGYCGGYMKCAYSQIGGTTEDHKNNTIYGTLINFDKRDRDLFKYYGDIWVA